MPPTRTSTSRSQASNISEVTKTARHLGAITVVDAQKNMNLPRKGDGATTAERSQTSAAAYSTSGVIGNFPHPSQSRSGAGRLVPPSTYATITANQRGPPSVAASSRRSVYNDSNAGPSWRGNTPAPYIGGPATNRSTAMGNGRKAEVLPRREFKKGVIIRAPLHEQDYQGASRQSNVTAADAHNKTESRFGTIYTKYRKMIVVECYQDHYIAVPLFTHGGRGLQYKRKPEEYISVQDHRSKEPFKALSRHGNLLTEVLFDDVNRYLVLSTAHITYPLSRKYDLPVIHEGRLCKASTKLLVSLYQRYAPQIRDLEEGEIEE